MEAPKRAWSILVNWCPRSGHSALRLITIGALVVSAFHLHDRANQLEQRERSLQRRIAAFSRQIQEKDERVRTLLALPAPLEAVVEASAAKSPLESSPSIDSVVRQAVLRRAIRPVALKTTDQ